MMRDPESSPVPEVDGYCEAIASLDWTMDFTNENGDSITLTIDDVEQLIHSLMHHRLLSVEVEVPENRSDCEGLLFGCGRGIAMRYDGDNFVTICLDPEDLNGWRPRQKEEDK
jgi:hypothetical protein